MQFNDEPDVAAAAATTAPSVGAQAVAAALALLESGSLTQHINSGALDDAVRCEQQLQCGVTRYIAAVTKHINTHTIQGVGSSQAAYSMGEAARQDHHAQAWAK